jgi:hypothetical protein
LRRGSSTPGSNPQTRIVPLLVLLLLTIVDRAGRMPAKEYEQIRMQQRLRLVIAATHPVGSILLLLNNSTNSYIVAMTGTARLPHAKDTQFRRDNSSSKVTTMGNVPDAAAHASTSKVAA